MQIPLWMILVPVIGAVVILLMGRSGIDKVRWMALGNVLVSLVLAIFMVAEYDPDRTRSGRPDLLQMQTDIGWLETIAGTDGRLQAVGPNIRFSLGVDGISLWLIGLTAVLMVTSVLVSWEAIQDRPASFYALMLLLQAGLVGVFSAQDIILFYLFFEFTLIPLFFMIGLWGGHDRRWAARKFFIYTFAGSVLTFLGLVFIVLSHSWMSRSPHLTFSIPQLTAELPQLVRELGPNRDYWLRVSPWIFAALFAGFAIKVPLFPFHTWLPLAHVQAPTAGSVLLAGVLLKIGSYGFLRFALPLVPEACWQYLNFVAVLAVIGIIYGALLALAQDDIKKLVAYSSVSHMGFCMLGLFALNPVGITGGLLQMVNHGLSTGALFALVGMLYERYHTRDIEAFGGLTRKFPWLAFCMVVVAFSSIGLPGLNGFTGEVLSLMGMFKVNRLYGSLGLTGIIIGAWYTLWLVQRTFFGRLREPLHETHGHVPAPPVNKAAHEHTHDHDHGQGHHAHGHTHDDVVHSGPGDMNFRELCAMAPIMVLIFAIGLYPQFFIRRMDPSIGQVAIALRQGRDHIVMVGSTVDPPPASGARVSTTGVPARAPGRHLVAVPAQQRSDQPANLVVKE